MRFSTAVMQSYENSDFAACMLMTRVAVVHGRHLIDEGVQPGFYREGGFCRGGGLFWITAPKEGPWVSPPPGKNSEKRTCDLVHYIA